MVCEWRESMKRYESPGARPSASTLYLPYQNWTQYQIPRHADIVTHR